MTVREAAERLNMHFMSVYKLVQTGDLPAAKIGSRWKIDPSQLDDWIARHGGQHRRWVLVSRDSSLADRLSACLGPGHEVEAAHFGELSVSLRRATDVVMIDAVADPHAAVAALAVVHAAEPRPFAILLVSEPAPLLLTGALDLGMVSLLSVDELLHAADEVGAILHWT